MTAFKQAFPFLALVVGAHIWMIIHYAYFPNI